MTLINTKMRLISLDVFRGIAIAAMILVNNPGSWGYMYPVLQHAEWDGCTPTDVVFPSFLLIVGVAIAFSLSKFSPEHRLGGDRVPPSVYSRIGRRCLLLFLLGLILNGFPNYDLANIRIMGVLQRIAIAYGLSAIAILNLSRRQLWLISIFTLIGYWLAMTMIPVPGYGPGNLSPEGNLGAFIDQTILGSHHLWRGGPYDPEGLFSTAPATVTVIIGYLTGEWLKSQPRNSLTVINLVMFALSSLVVGYLWGIWFPINKALWTSSYVLVTAGWGLLLLAFCYGVIEVKNWRRWGKPFEIMGVNAIFLFVASGLLARILIRIRVGSEPVSPNLKTWIYENIFVSWAGLLNGSLMYAVATVIFWWAIAYIMYNRRWFLKV
ncbi:MAG: DUF1624 domain-containing protein [Arthrospira sp. PLM2.Bin9]|nr:heparan-alpha-glucosaminide N-acetyltransferase domain-containing protein [Arthrospira sp. PLM2.Bin9]TVU53552.1 MAG: DUF1624 domain-containing protein [Arthrospira sp. PLM2.Bin9]